MNHLHITTIIGQRCLSVVVIGLFFLFCFVSQVSAQAYCTLSAGYSFGFPSMYLGKEPTNSWAGVYDGLANGVDISAGLGYMFIPSIGAEIVGSYLVGTKTQQFGGTESIETYSLSLSAITPRAVISFPLSSSINIYTKLGPYIAFPSLKNQSQYRLAILDPTSSKEQGVTFEGGIALGYCSSVGIGLTSDNVMVIAEVCFVNASWGPERLVNSSGKTVATYRDQYEGPAYDVYLRNRLGVGSISLKTGVQISF